MFAGGAVSIAFLIIQRDGGTDILIIGLERRWGNR